MAELLPTDPHLNAALSAARVYGAYIPSQRIAYEQHIVSLGAEIERLRVQLRQIDEAERVPHVESEMKVALMAALARQGLS